ncbi:MAG TPA: hypothetical protein VGK40_03860 [Verrucomicrobiae bacterium]
MKTTFCLLLCASSLAGQARSNTLVVHEWGTFTSLQDEAGRTLSGINTDEEPLPDFVHDLSWSPGLVSRGKGAPLHYPDITMRLETPVIYFHPPTGSPPLTVTVSVAFRGGWLTQFYPDALWSAPGAFYKLNAMTVGKLAWPQLNINGHANGPDTSARAWTAPRAVHATSITATNGESERYVFYRGVGHLNAPLRVSRLDGGLDLQSQLDPSVADRLTIQKLWLVESRADGGFAFRVLKPLIIAANSRTTVATTPASFRDEDFSAGNLAELRQLMRSAIVNDGLFADEADALLNTWETSYFKSAGLRLFFLVPRAWTDHYLPLDFSTPTQLTRLMVGRIELVTPEQRELLRRIAKAPILERPLPKLADLRQSSGKEEAVPAAYLALGRFRNALIMDEQQQRPTEPLRAFIALNGLDQYQP